jgi:acyl-CoA thioesterase-1
MSCVRFLSCFSFLAGFWLAGALSAAEAPSANAADSASRRIVILGDSITAGYGLDPAEAYPAVLQGKVTAAHLPFTVVNAGVSGDTTAGGLRRVAWAVGPGAEILVIALGGNDGLRGLSPKQTAENLAGIVTKAREKNPAVKVFIAGMQMPGNMGADYVGQFKAVFPQVAKDQKATLIPFLLQGVGGIEKLNQADQIHPNADGQKIIAEMIWKVLEKDLPAAKAGN